MPFAITQTGAHDPGKSEDMWDFLGTPESTAVEQSIRLALGTLCVTTTAIDIQCCSMLSWLTRREGERAQHCASLRDRFGRSASDNPHTLATLWLEDSDGAAMFTHWMQVACKQLLQGVEDPINEILRLAIHRGLPRENPSTTALRPLSLERGADAAKLIEAVSLQFHEPGTKEASQSSS
jgi:hypothetical protein